MNRQMNMMSRDNSESYIPRTTQMHKENIHWSKCYEDSCDIHYQEKMEAGSFPQDPNTTRMHEEFGNLEQRMKNRHNMMNWTACYDDSCMVHLSEKQGSGWFPKKPKNHKGSVPWTECHAEQCFIHEQDKKRLDWKLNMVEELAAEIPGPNCEKSFMKPYRQAYEEELQENRKNRRLIRQAKKLVEELLDEQEQEQLQEKNKTTNQPKQVEEDGIVEVPESTRQRIERVQELQRQEPHVGYMVHYRQAYQEWIQTQGIKEPEQGYTIVPFGAHNAPGVWEEQVTQQPEEQETWEIIETRQLGVMQKQRTESGTTTEEDTDSDDDFTGQKGLLAPFGDVTTGTFYGVDVYTAIEQQRKGYANVRLPGDDIRTCPGHENHPNIAWVHCLYDECATHRTIKINHDFYPRREEGRPLINPRADYEIAYWEVAGRGPNRIMMKVRNGYPPECFLGNEPRECRTIECEIHKDWKVMEWHQLQQRRVRFEEPKETQGKTKGKKREQSPPPKYRKQAKN